MAGEHARNDPVRPAADVGSLFLVRCLLKVRSHPTLCISFTDGQPILTPC